VSRVVCALAFIATLRHDSGSHTTQDRATLPTSRGTGGRPSPVMSSVRGGPSTRSRARFGATGVAVVVPTMLFAPGMACRGAAEAGAAEPTGTLGGTGDGVPGIPTASDEGSPVCASRAVRRRSRVVSTSKTAGRRVPTSRLSGSGRASPMSATERVGPCGQWPRTTVVTSRPWLRPNVIRAPTRARRRCFPALIDPEGEARPD
jgi:hypothetical protein